MNDIKNTFSSRVGLRRKSRLRADWDDQMYRRQRFSCAVLLMCLILFAFNSSGCGIGAVGGRVGSKYRYWYGLTKPIVSNRLRFQDDRIFIQFRIDESFVNFRLQNVSPQPLRILWDRVSIVVGGKVSPIKYSANAYATKPVEKKPTIIPVNGYVIDFVVPADKVRLTGGGWIELVLFPTRDYGRQEVQNRILQNVGKSITMFLPLAFGTEVVEYVFEFKVAEIEKISWKKYRPPRRRYKPAAPRAGVQETWATAILISLFIVAGVYFLFIRKPTPEE